MKYGRISEIRLFDSSGNKTFKLIECKHEVKDGSRVFDLHKTGARGLGGSILLDLFSIYPPLCNY